MFVTEVSPFSIEQITELSQEVVDVTARLVVELDSANQMTITAENLDRVAKAPDQVWLAARETTEDKIVGMAVLVTPPVLTNVRAELLNIVVDPAYRRQGVAKALIQRALQEAEARNVNTVHLETGESNAAGNNLFQKLGAKPCELTGYNFFLHTGPRL